MVRYLVELAKSARAICQECKSKINKGVLRVGKASDNGEFESVKYYHCGCWRVPRTVKSCETLEGYGELSDTDKKEVKTQLEKPRKTLATILSKNIKPGSEGELYTQMMSKFSAPALKEILKLNYQPQDRVKAGLVAAVVDGMLHGAIPSCPTCIEGKLTLTPEQTYKCPGSFDISSKRFKRCTFSCTTIERTFWRMPSDYRVQFQ